METLKNFIRENPHMPIALVLVFFVGLLGSYLILTITNKPKITKSQIETLQKENLIPEAPKVSDVKDNSYNILLLGSGGKGHSGGGLTDSIIVVHVNPDTKKAALISIPRDMWTIGGYKINAGVTNSNLSAFKGTIQNITGLTISYVVSTDFTGITQLIDSLGGVEITLEKSYDDYFYPVRGLENEMCGLSPETVADLHLKYSGFELEKQFTCRYEHLHADAGKNTIDGTKALKLARSRHGDSDFGRSERQFAILKGILTKLISLDALRNIDETYYSLLKFVKADINLDAAKDLISVFGNIGEYNVAKIHLSDQNVLTSSKSISGAYILIPKAGENNFEEIKSYIKSQLF